MFSEPTSWQYKSLHYLAGRMIFRNVKIPSVLINVQFDSNVLSTDEKVSKCEYLILTKVFASQAKQRSNFFINH